MADKDPHLGKLAPYFRIGEEERSLCKQALYRPLSGYLGGQPTTGYFVNKLIDKWQDTFRVPFAIPCNSATSGLLAACMAVGIKPGDLVWTSGYTMSATAACCRVLGAHTAFIDIETKRFSMNWNRQARPLPKCIIVTNLFGHPAYLADMRTWCDSNNVWMIEDNAQAPFAKENGRYTGTIGHIGVFSLNVHKHIQCGEGGVCTTSLDYLAERLDGAINHGELSRAPLASGLNLRMTEPIAAIACAQLDNGKKLVKSRIELAEEVTDMFVHPMIEPLRPDENCKHVYYIWSAVMGSDHRTRLVQALNKRGFPMCEGYSPTLCRIFPNDTPCIKARQMEDQSLITFEVCAYDPTRHQLKVMREIAKRAMGETYDRKDD